jgi:hypothetical protein
MIDGPYSIKRIIYIGTFYKHHTHIWTKTFPITYYQPLEVYKIEESFSTQLKYCTIFLPNPNTYYSTSMVKFSTITTHNILSVGDFKHSFMVSYASSLCTSIFTVTDGRNMSHNTQYHATDVYLWLPLFLHFLNTLLSPPLQTLSIHVLHLAPCT